MKVSLLNSLKTRLFLSTPVVRVIKVLSRTMKRCESFVSRIVDSLRSIAKTSVDKTTEFEDEIEPEFVPYKPSKDSIPKTYDELRAELDWIGRSELNELDRAALDLFEEMMKRKSFEYCLPVFVRHRARWSGCYV